MFKKRLCKNCIHFKSSMDMFQHTMGICKEITQTSAPYMADFIQTYTKENEWLNVWWNFGCIRFKNK